MIRELGLFLAGITLVACASAPEPMEPLGAPPGTNPAAKAAIAEGNFLFAQGQWAPAKEQYETAVESQPDLAEAHYNLALTLDMLGRSRLAREHYLTAANLAPGNKVIWDSPPLRGHAEEIDRPLPDATAPQMNPMGGFGGR